MIRHVRSLGIEHSQKSFDDCLRFLSQPSLNAPWLLLYDNVDDPDLDLSSLLPQGDDCATVITSRNRMIGELCLDAHLELEAMLMEEAVELLLWNSNSAANITDQAREQACAIARALCRLPLALQQARSYMFQTKVPIGTYLQRLASSKEKVLGQSMKHQWNMRYLSTYAAFEASFDILPSQIQKFLRLLSYFHWNKSPIELITLAAKSNCNQHSYIAHGKQFRNGKALLEDLFFQDCKRDSFNLDRMAITLQSYSLISLADGIDTTLAQIPLLHEWVRYRISEPDRLKYQSAAAMLLALAARDHYAPVAQYLINHVLHMAPFWDQMHVSDAKAFANILRDGGVFLDELKLRDRIVNELKGRSDTDSITLFDASSSLALVYYNLGRLDEAESLQIEVLKLRKQEQGERHVDTIRDLFTLSFIYRHVGRYKEAASLLAEVISLRSELLGQRHPDTMAASTRLARVYRDLRRLKEAQWLQEQVLDQTKEILGERHSDTLSASYSLAITYRDLGRIEEAKQLQADILRVQKEVRGDRHPAPFVPLINWPFYIDVWDTWRIPGYWGRKYGGCEKRHWEKIIPPPSLHLISWPLHTVD